MLALADLKFNDQELSWQLKKYNGMSITEALETYCKKVYNANNQTKETQQRITGQNDSCSGHKKQLSIVLNHLQCSKVARAVPDLRQKTTERACWRNNHHKQHMLNGLHT